MELRAIRWISDPIAVRFAEPPALRKKPGCPQEFTWRGEVQRVTEQLGEWHDYRRRGRMALNMRPDHSARAAQRGSWGVGRDYYRVRTAGSRIFDLYYDRAPRSACARGGGWFLYRELAAGAVDEGPG